MLIEQFRFGKALALEVLFACQHVVLADRPVDVQVWIVESYRCLALWGIDVVHLVCEDGFLAQYEESVGKAAWDKELALVVFAQFHSHVFAEGRRALTYVDSLTSFACENSPF